MDDAIKILKERAEALAHTGEAEAKPAAPLSLFTRGKQLYGVHLAEVEGAGRGLPALQGRVDQRAPSADPVRALLGAGGFRLAKRFQHEWDDSHDSSPAGDYGKPVCCDATASDPGESRRARPLENGRLAAALRTVLTLPQ